MRRLLFVPMIIAGWALRAPAQEAITQYPKIEGFAGYSGVLTNSVLIPIAPSLNGGTDLDSSTGLEAAVIKNLGGYLGLKADSSLHFGHYNEEDFVIPCANRLAPRKSPNPILGCSSSCSGPKLSCAITHGLHRLHIFSPVALILARISAPRAQL